MDNLRQNLIALTSDLGVELFGVADLHALLPHHPDLFLDLPGPFPRAVSLGLRLADAVIDNIQDRPTPLYFHLYRQANYQLDRAALQVAIRLQQNGFAAVPVPASQVIAEGPMRGHLSHRLVAWAAGLGWRGRNNLLVNPKVGSRLRLVTILTDAPLVPDSPLDRDCGSCRACIAVCPAHAIAENPCDFNLDACFQKLSEFRRLPAIGQHICGVCVKACRPPRSQR